MISMSRWPCVPNPDRLNSVLVDDPQGAETHVGRVVVVREGKTVERVEPAVLGMSSFIATPNLDH
jgi:hypothetical protein